MDLFCRQVLADRPGSEADCASIARDTNSDIEASFSAYGSDERFLVSLSFIEGKACVQVAQKAEKSKHPDGFCFLGGGQMLPPFQPGRADALELQNRLRDRFPIGSGVSDLRKVLIEGGLNCSPMSVTGTCSGPDNGYSQWAVLLQDGRIKEATPLLWKIDWTANAEGQLEELVASHGWYDY